MGNKCTPKEEIKVEGMITENMVVSDDNFIEQLLWILIYCLRYPPTKTLFSTQCFKITDGDIIHVFLLDSICSYSYIVKYENYKQENQIYSVKLLETCSYLHAEDVILEYVYFVQLHHKLPEIIKDSRFIKKYEIQQVGNVLKRTIDISSVDGHRRSWKRQSNMII